jgi:hypothetical protein
MQRQAERRGGAIVRPVAVFALILGAAMSASCGDDVVAPSQTFNQARGFDSWVMAVAPALDGSGDVYVGGAFTTYGSKPVSHLVRMHRDGTLDEQFAAYDGYVVSVAPTTDGSLYLVDSAQRVLRLRHDGTVDTDFTPPKATAVTPALDGTGDVFVTSGSSFVRLHGDGSKDGAFAAPVLYGGISGSIAATDGTGDVFLWGSFRGVDGVPANGLSRLHGDGTLAPPFAGAVDATTTVPADDATTVAAALATDRTGAIYRVSGQGYLVRFRADGTLDSTFARQKPFERLFRVVPMPDGTVYVAGSDGSSYDSPTDIVRLENDGTVDPTFTDGTGLDELYSEYEMYGVEVSVAAAVDGSDDLFVGGNFTSWNGTGVNGLMRLRGDGTIDSSTEIGTGFDGWVDCVAVSNDGSGDVYVGGTFTKYDGVEVPRLVRLHADGTLDDTFELPASDFKPCPIASVEDESGDLWVAATLPRFPYTLARVHADGTLFRILRASTGNFSNVTPAADGTGEVYVGGQDGLIRARADARLDPSFQPDAMSLRAIAPDIETGEIYVLQGSLVPGPDDALVRLHHDGSRDDTFATEDLGAMSPPAVATDGSGDLFVGTSVTSYGGLPVHGIVRLHADATADGAFLASLGTCDGGECVVTQILPTTDGSNDVYVAVKPQSTGWKDGVVRLHADGTLATSVDTASALVGHVSQLIAANDGTGDVFAGGSFKTYETTMVDRLMRLDPSGSVK